MRLLSAFLLLALATTAAASEDERNAAWCAEKHGITVEQLRDQRGEVYEVVIPGGRVDCVWNGYAIEADWIHRVDGCMGQATRYARVMGLKPGCLLLVGQEKDCKWLTRALEATAGSWTQVGEAMYRLRVWIDGRCEQ